MASRLGEQAGMARRVFLKKVGLASAAMGAAGLLDAGKARAASSTLRWSSAQDPGTLDPLTNQFDYAFPPFSTVFEGLTRYPPGDKWQAVNTLAESLEQSSDGKTISFTLKQGIPFHGGYGEVLAEDVQYSFYRAVGKEKMYPDAAKEDTSWYAGDFGSLQEIKVTGKYSGVILFDKPFSPMVRLTLPYATSGLIVSKKAVQTLGKAAWLKKPIGTGPYEIVSYTPNRELIMKRFDQYGGATGQHASAFPWEEIRLSLVGSGAAPTGAAMTAGVESGDVDFTYGITPLDAQRLQSNSALKVYGLPQPLNYNFVQINVLHPKLKNIKVRQAIRLGLDIPAIIQAQDLDLTTRLNALIARQMGVGYWPDAPVYERNVDKAKSLLQEAGVSSLELDIAIPGTPPATSKDVMQVIQSNLAEIGIKVNILLSPPDSYVKDRTVGQLYWTNYGGAPDPYYQFEWFTCAQFSLWDWAFWCNADYDNMWNQIAIEEDEAKRTQIAVKMQQLMDESAGFVWSNYQFTNAVTRAGVEAAFDPNGNPIVQYFKPT